MKTLDLLKESISLASFSTDTYWTLTELEPLTQEQQMLDTVTELPSVGGEKRSSTQHSFPTEFRLPAELDIPTECGDYKLLCRIGAGGMGSVFKARHKSTGEFAAVKLLHSHLVYHEQAARRFAAEVRAASRMTHDGIVSIHGYGTAPDGSTFIIMELVDGRNLAELLKAETRLPVERALPIFMDICEAVGHAHEKEVIHRDLKPGNVLITCRNGTETVKVFDFGIATVLDEDHARDSSCIPEIFGSPRYMSPEHCMGRPVDGRSDIYSLGCIMYEVLTGVQPFEAANPLQSMLKQIQTEPPPFAESAPAVRIPAAVESLVMRTLAKDPKDRPQSMSDLAAQLRSLRSRTSL